MTAHLCFDVPLATLRVGGIMVTRYGARKRVQRREVHPTDEIVGCKPRGHCGLLGAETHRYRNVVDGACTVGGSTVRARRESGLRRTMRRPWRRTPDVPRAQRGGHFPAVLAERRQRHHADGHERAEHRGH